MRLRLAQGPHEGPVGAVGKAWMGPAAWVSFLASSPPERRVTDTVLDVGPVPSPKLSHLSEEEGGEGRLCSWHLVVGRLAWAPVFIGKLVSS